MLSDNIQSCCTLFLILNQFMSGSNCWFLICIQVSQEAGKVVWYSHLLRNFPQFSVIHTVKGFGVVNEAEVDVFLGFLCFLHDPMNVENFISGSSAFSKSSLYILKFSIHVLLKPSLKDFEYSLASMWDECHWDEYRSLNILWHCPSFGMEKHSIGIGMKTDFFQPCGHCWVFQICWDIEWSTLTASSFRILNSFKFSLNFDTASGSTFAYWIYVNMSATDLWGRFISFSGLWKSYHTSQDHPLFLAALSSCDIAVFCRECWSTCFRVSHSMDQLLILTA